MDVSILEMEFLFMKHDNSHLTLDERKIIQTGIENRSTKVAIANTIGKDPTTVAKEIRKHRQLHSRNTANYPNICVHRKICGTCFSKCECYQEQSLKEEINLLVLVTNVLILLNVI